MASNDDLHQAIHDGDKERVQELLTKGTNINQLSGMQGTPLCAAILARMPEIVQLLVDNGCEVNAKDFNGETPLNLAIRKQYPECVQILLNHGKCDINKIDLVSGRPPVCTAVLLNNVPILEMLVAVGCDVNTTDRRDNTALHLALRHTNVRCVEILLSGGHTLDKCDLSGMFPLHLAVTSENLNILQMVVESTRCMEVDQQTKFGLDTAVHVACRANNIMALQMLLNYGACVNLHNVESQSPLLMSCCDNHENLIELLLQSGAKPNSLGQISQQCVYSSKYHKRGVLGKVTPLHVAVLLNNRVLVAKLLQFGADPLMADCRGQNALFFALEESRVEIVDLLLDSCSERVGDIVKQDHAGRNLVFAAMKCEQSKHTERFIRRLVALGCSVRQTDLEGRTVLHLFTYAAEFLKCDNVLCVAQTLLECGSNVNAAGDFGCTAMHLCVWSEYPLALASLYILYGADLTLQNTEGETAFEMALGDENVAMATLLVNCGYNCSGESLVNSNDPEDLSVVLYALGRDFIDWIYHRAHNATDLKTLCRKKIIEVFKTCGVDPKRMRELPLPERLIDFVMLDLKSVLYRFV